MSQENKNASSDDKPKKDFVQWLTEDALPESKSILAELKAINAERDAAKTWLKENNMEITDESIKNRIDALKK